MAHVYKDLLIALAEDKEIQAKYLNPNYKLSWFDVKGNSTAMTQLMSGVPAIDYEVEFRIKPRTHIVNGHEINAPEVKMPVNGVLFWHPMGNGKVNWGKIAGAYTNIEYMYLNAGLMYLTEEDAQAHSNAWMNPKV